MLLCFFFSKYTTVNDANYWIAMEFGTWHAEWSVCVLREWYSFTCDTIFLFLLRQQNNVKMKVICLWLNWLAKSIPSPASDNLTTLLGDASLWCNFGCWQASWQAIIIHYFRLRRFADRNSAESTINFGRLAFSCMRDYVNRSQIKCQISGIFAFFFTYSRCEW